MGMFRPDAGPYLLERRAARRWHAQCAAALETLTGESLGQLWDLSETGARVKLDDPPAPGSAAILKWCEHRARCSVVWTTDDMCGVAFEDPLDSAQVSATTRMIGEVQLPVAAVRNIPMGRKRADCHGDLGRLSPALGVGHSGLVVALQRRPGLQETAPSGLLTAGEEMFFFGSPLAHVLSYELYLKSSIHDLARSPTCHAVDVRYWRSVDVGEAESKSDLLR